MLSSSNAYTVITFSHKAAFTNSAPRNCLLCTIKLLHFFFLNYKSLFTNFLKEECSFARLPFNLTLLFFLTGEHDRTKDEGTEQYFDVSQLYLNKHFQTYSGYGHDIALIRLSRPAILNQYVSLACLPRQNERVATGKLCYLTGNVHLKVVMVISWLKISLSWVTHHLDGLITYFLTRWEKKSLKKYVYPILK